MTHSFKFGKNQVARRFYGFLCGALLIATFLWGVGVVKAQQPVPPTPAPNIDALMQQAQSAIDTGDRASTQASLVINFIQIVALTGGVLAALAGLGLGVTGLRTLSEYQGDLGKARQELDEMRAQLLSATDDAAQMQTALQNSNTEQIQELREQAANAYRALSLLQLGQQQFEVGNIRGAQNMYEEANDLNPNNPVIIYQLGELYLIERDLPHAAEYLQKAVAQSPRLAPAYAALGLVRRLEADKIAEIQARNQVYADAEHLLLKALELNPGVRDANKESVYTTLGSLYRRQGRIDDALHYYTQAEKITPNNSYLFTNLAQLHFVHGDSEQARAYFQRSLDASLKKLQSNPSDNWARGDVVTAHLALGSSAEAFQELDHVIRQAHSIGVLEVILGGFHNLKRAPHPPADIDQAIQTVEKAIHDQAPEKAVSV